MYIDEIRSMSTDEVLDKIEDLKVEMYTYRLQEGYRGAEGYNAFPQNAARYCPLENGPARTRIGGGNDFTRGAGCLTTASVWWEQSSATRWKRRLSSPSRIARCTRYITRWFRRRAKSWRMMKLALALAHWCRSSRAARSANGNAGWSRLFLNQRKTWRTRARSRVACA